MSGPSGGSTHAPTRCLYVALNVPRHASSSEIKKAYRREALVWHPDKNVGNEAEAQVRFQELQHAYAVLSDAHERKWYDDHRDEILNPRSSRHGGVGEDSDADDDGLRTVNLTKYFSTVLNRSTYCKVFTMLGSWLGRWWLVEAYDASAFTDFGDGGSGFYQTYSRAFQEIWEAEKEWSNFESTSGSDITNGGGGGGGGGGGWGKGEAPKMGLSGDSYEVADVFYSSWSAFVSGLSFAWVDEHNVNEAENRRVRRLMEKENGKKRSMARRKYQDEVHALVEFCRRRDRRVIRHKLQLAKEKEARERQRAEEAVAKKADMKLRKEEWLRARQAEEEAVEEERAREGGNAAFRLEESDDEDGGGGRKKKGNRRAGSESQKVLVFRCAVCKKDFKSAGQMKNHETSKAHKKKIEELDRQMLRDARESGKRYAREQVGEDVSDSEGNVSDEGDGGEEEEEEEEEEPDFFMDNAMRELDLGSGLDAAEGGLAGGSAVGDSRERAVAEGSLSQGAADLHAPQTDRELAGVEHAPRHEEQRPERRNGSGKGEEQVPRHGRRREREHRGFDLFSSSSSGSDGIDSDTDSSSGGEIENGSGWPGSGTDAAEAKESEAMATIPMASASTRVDSGGGMQAAVELEAFLAGAEIAHSAAQSFAGLAGISRSAGTIHSASENLDVRRRDEEVRSIGGHMSSDGKGKVGQSGSEDQGNGCKKSPRKDKAHGPHDNNSQKEPEHAARGGRKGGTQGHCSDSSDGDEEAESDGKMKATDAHEHLRSAGKRVRRKAAPKAGHTRPSATGKESDEEEDKGARRRRRQAIKAARASVHSKGSRDRGVGKGEGEAGGEDGAMSCRVCLKSFPSRSKLFAHVKKEGHALAS